MSLAGRQSYSTFFRFDFRIIFVVMRLYVIKDKKDEFRLQDYQENVF